MTKLNPQEILNNVKKIHQQAEAYVEQLFSKAMDEDETIKSIIFKGTPNSYSDEGYACEGMLLVSTDEIDNSDVCPYEYCEEDQVGVWSADSYDQFYDAQQSKYVPRTKENTHSLTFTAMKLFNECNKLSEIIGMDGYFEINITRD